MTTSSDPRAASLAWAENQLAQQPEHVRRDYEQAAREIARALSQPVYSLSVSIPCNPASHDIVVRVGSLVHQVFNRTSEATLIRKLHVLADSPQQMIRESIQLTCYLTAQTMLSALPDEQALREHYTGFDRQGNLLVPDRHAAEVIVENLVRFMHLLHQIETLYPAWRTADRYSEKHGLVATHLIGQGRALANFHTRNIIQNIVTAWQSGEMTRGLTIFLPYLDERQYRMENYKIIVIPPGRILFRPEFIVGACRVSERHVRSDSTLSQATRWQLLSQLDTIIQAFEIASIG